MRRRLLKYFRVAVSLLFLFAAGFLFVDFAGAFSASLIRGVTWIQFVPSLLSFLNLLGFLGLGFFVVLGVTLLCGRVYCSTVCPLGILQDVSSRVSRFCRATILKRRRIYRPSRPQNILRYSVLAVTAAVFVFGSVFFLNLLDPFSLFGKIFSGLVRPVYYGVNNVAADLLQSFGIFTLYHVETRSMSVAPLIFPAVMLGVIVILSLTRGRLYCNTICPVGSLLGIVSKFALYRIRIDDSLCNNCGQCSINCKAECIDIKDNRVDFTRCVGCFNCLNVCSREGIGYKSHWHLLRSRPDAVSRSDAPVAEAREISDEAAIDPQRRSFLFFLTACFFGSSAASKLLAGPSRPEAGLPGPAGVVVTQPSTIPEQKSFPVSPPGSRGLRHFNGSCTACQLCVSACPTRVLQPSFLEYGVAGIMQPRLDFHAGFCNFDCVRCTEVCPTGAILPLTVDQKHIAQIGVVRLELGNCVVQTERTACGACAEHCPTQAVRMVPWENGLTIPEIEVDQCIGCGACEYICPTRPYRAIYIDGLEVHAQARPPVIEPLKFKPPEEDFPF